MREKWQKQMPLMAHILDHPQSQELEVISGIIDANSTICQYILQDLNTGKSEAQRAGAKGMSADQVLRCSGRGPARDLADRSVARCKD